MRVLGKTNLKVNEIGLGGIPIQGTNKQIVKSMIKTMCDEGVNFIDTARGYTNSEELLGEGIKGVREKFILATKSMSRTYEGMKKDIETSLEKLQTSYIDLYQMHNVQLMDDIKGAYEALEEAKQQGKVKHIGLTTHSVEVLQREAVLNRFETLQFPYNIIESQGEVLFEEANKKNIGIIVMKPLAGGSLDDADLALKYILNNKNISVVIPGMESVEQILQNNSVKAGGITDEEALKIEKIRKELKNDFCRRCGYCQPCPVGINIPLVFLCEGYYVRYGLEDWAKSRYNSMKVKPNECINCGRCEGKCPYKLNIREKIKKIANLMEGTHE